MKKEIKGNCDKCKRLIKVDTLYKLSWRYNDKKRTYLHSTCKIIHTGYMYLCINCLNKLTK